MNTIEDRLAALEAATGVSKFENNFEVMRKEYDEMFFERGCDIDNLIDFINDMLSSEGEFLERIGGGYDFYAQAVIRQKYLVNRANWLALRKWGNDTTAQLQYFKETRGTDHEYKYCEEQGNATTKENAKHE